MKFLSRYRLLPALLWGFLAASCATPQKMMFDVDVMQKKPFILQLDNQRASVVATYDEAMGDSTLMADIARSAAAELEKQNVLEEGSIGAFTIPASEYKGSEDKEYLEQLMLATGSECLVIINGFNFHNYNLSRFYDTEQIPPVAQPIVLTQLALTGKTDLEVYDAILEKSLFHQTVTDSVFFRIPTEESYSEKSVKEFISRYDTLIVAAFGTAIADNICNTWIQEEWMLIDYPSEGQWHKAYKEAMDFKWEEAINIWIPLTEDNNPEKASYAAFNIAVACQMLGETDLALEWLAFSRQKHSFSEAISLQNYLQHNKKQ